MLREVLGREGREETMKKTVGCASRNLETSSAGKVFEQMTK